MNVTLEQLSFDALALAGDTEEYGEGHKIHKQIKRLAAQAVGYVLNAHKWSFMRAKTTLKGIKGNFTLPGDCEYILKVYTDDYIMMPYGFDADADKVEVLYVSNLMASQFAMTGLLQGIPSLIYDAITYTLAARIASSLRDNASLARELNQQATLYIDQAQFRDAQQYASNDQTTRGIHEYH